ncbi:btb poz domain-containing protein 18 [Limosa lapponica baueri]|uniref:Btb poz domain-containing protein 18 n=1 Tax=Limosa lapponica baueri TaxID=1758121 RepID=A0A2I0TWN7_LIMLA|nr:btb poz domain-containing protein 18 [Limosa lapponica baueri]
MGSPPAAPRLLYRSTRLLRTAFQQLHRQQQRDDVFCDVVLQAEGEAVMAHCCILSVCSPFFMEQLGQELPPRGGRVVLELGGLKIRALRKLVRFLYTAELEATREEVQEVLVAARRLRVTELESLQLRGGRLVRPGPQRQLDRSCLRAPRNGSPVAVGTKAEPSGSPGSTGVPPQGRPCSPGTVDPSPGPVERVKLRKVESGGCWEVVRERQPPTAMAAGKAGAVELQPPPDLGAVGRVGRRSPPWRPPRRKQGQEPPAPQQGCRQAVLPGDPLGDPEEEEVDVGTAEPCLPPDTCCVWPCPSSGSDEEVDVLAWG